MASLTTRVLNSLGWILTNMVAKNLILSVRIVILWRLLDAEAFGLNGMAWLAINGLSLLQDMGFQQALVQRKTDLDKAISVTWFSNVAIRLFIYAILFFVAPAIANQFKEPQVSPILRVAGFCIVLGSFGSANEALLRKNFKFRALLVVDTIELVVQTAVQIGMALLGYGVWSLVWGTVVSVVARSASLWWIAPIRVGRFDIKIAREMFHFGKHMTVSTILIWLIGNVDYYLVGRFLGTAALGYYTLAFKLSHLIATNVGRLLGSVLFPAFAEIGHDYDRIRPAWLRSVRYSMVLMMPMGLGMIVFASEIIRSFFLPACEVVIAPLALLTVFALCRGIGVTLGDLQKGIGKPHLLTRVAFFHLLIMGPALVLVTVPVESLLGLVLDRAGLAGVAHAIGMILVSPVGMAIGISAVSAVVSGSAIFVILLSLYLTSREVKFTASQVVESLRPPVVAGAGMVAAGLAGKLAVGALFPAFPPLASLIVLGGLSFLAYLAIIWFRFPAVGDDLRRVLRRRKKDSVAARVDTLRPTAP